MATRSATLTALIRAALREDVGPGDITSRAVIPAGARVDARIVAKAEGVVAGLEPAASVFRAVDRTVRVHLDRRDGQSVDSGQVLATVRGNARSVLNAERTALNLLGHLSGVATLTRQFVQRVKPYSVAIFDTRKTLPGLRDLQKQAVVAGGGVNHRMGLYDAVLIKTNHLLVMQQARPGRGREAAIVEAIVAARKRSPHRQVEIEVTTLAELRAALGAKPDAVLLDNMDEATIRESVRLRDAARTSRARESLLEVSGGVTLDTVRALAATGVDRISIGQLTHSAPALDVSLWMHAEPDRVARGA